MKYVELKVDGQKISGRLFYPPIPVTKSPAVLFIHGWTSAQDRYYEQAEVLAEQGFICLTFDMRGHGESEGDYKVQTRQNFLNDVLAAYDLLANDKLVDASNVSVIGSSFGSYLGVLLSSKREVRNLILRVPANYPNGNMSETIYQYAERPETLSWRQQAATYYEVESLRCLHDFNGQIIIVESGEDELVPHQTIQNYLEAVKDKGRLAYIVMKGAPHSITNFPEYKKQFSKIVSDWLKDKA